MRAFSYELPELLDISLHGMHRYNEWPVINVLYSSVNTDFMTDFAENDHSSVLKRPLKSEWSTKRNRDIFHSSSPLPSVSRLPSPCMMYTVGDG